MEVSYIDFAKKVNTAIASLGAETLNYDRECAKKYQEQFKYVEAYAWNRRLFNTVLSLYLVQGFLLGTGKKNVEFRKEGLLPFDYFSHCLSVTRMLVDLHLPLKQEEEDVVLSAALCHVLVKKINFPMNGRELMTDYHLHPRIYDIISMNERTRAMTDPELAEFFTRIQQNRLALLVKLADRGNVVEQLYGMSTWEAREYVFETRKYFFPMCIYAKENYEELYGVISILMEKMRSLIEVTDILSARYQERETALNNEILTLREENSRIRGIIIKLKGTE